MLSLRSRLVAVLALALVACSVSQSADARPTQAPSFASRHTPIFASPGNLRGTSLSAALQAASAMGARASETRSALGTGFSDTGTTFGTSDVFSVSSVDYDADGKLDVMTTGCADESCGFLSLVNRLYHNNGNGTFSENTTSGLPVSWFGSNSWADYDSDGYLDVLITGCSTDLFCEELESRLYHNNGNGTFSLNTKAALPGVMSYLVSVFGDRVVKWFDYNNDGRLDLLLGGYSISVTAKLVGPIGGSLRLFRNNGDGSFSESTNQGLPAMFVTESQTADYNADGYVDILVSGCSDAECSSYATKLFHNDGDGTFSEDTRAAFPALEYPWIESGDFDADGFPDIVMSGDDATSGDPVTKIFRNSGDGAFSENTTSGLPNLGNVLLLCGDYDSDGRVDILLNGYVTSYDDYISRIYRNNGNGTFSVDTSAGLPDAYAWFTQGDYDSDGGLDLIMYFAPPNGSATIYRNTTTSNGGLFYPPEDLRVRLTGARQATFSWETSLSKPESNSLTYNLRVGTRPGASDVVSAMSASSDGARYLPTSGNAAGRTFAKVTLPHRGNYYWSVQTVNASFVGSGFAEEKKFIVPGRVSIKLTKTKINVCGSYPLTTTVTGRVNPIFTPVATIILKRRYGLHDGWREIARRQTSHFGVYGFQHVGKGSKRSFWLRVVVTPTGGGSVVSRVRQVIVKDPGSCRMPG